MSTRYQWMSLGAVVTLVSSVTLAGGYAGDPTAIDGLQFWVKADAGVETNDVGGVTNWCDMSGHARNAVAPGGGVPAHIAAVDGFGGKPAVRFDGIDDVLSVASTITTNRECTVFVVGNCRTTDTAYLFTIRNAATPLLHMDVVANKARFLVRNTASVTASASSPGVNLDTNTFATMIGRLTQTAADNWTAEVFVNSPEAAATANADFGGDAVLGAGARLGCVYTGSAYAYSACDIAEGLLYDRSLGDAELYAIGRFLASRYGVGLSGFPPSGTVVVIR